mgnify:CR=1 FL=1
MNITPIFPTPVAYFFDFISSKERLDIWKRIKNTPHYDHDAIQGNGFSTHLHNPHLLDKKIKVTYFQPHITISSDLPSWSHKIPKITSQAIFENLRKIEEIEIKNAENYFIQPSRQKNLPSNFINEKVNIKEIDYFFSNAISRASKTMSECRQIKYSSKKTGTNN